MARSGSVLGKHLRDVIGQLLVHSEAPEAFLAREHAALAAIDPASERPWDEFVEALARVAATVRRPLQVAVGERIVGDAKPEFERWGFDTAEKVLADWDAPFGASILDAPEEQIVVTLKYEPGQAFLRAGAVLPAGLVEGYIRGVVRMFGAELLELEHHEVAMNDRPFHLFKLRWRPAAAPRAVPRRTTDRMVLGLRTQKVA